MTERVPVDARILTDAHSIRFIANIPGYIAPILAGLISEGLEFADCEEQCGVKRVEEGGCEHAVDWNSDPVLRFCTPFLELTTSIGGRRSDQLVTAMAVQPSPTGPTVGAMPFLTLAPQQRQQEAAKKASIVSRMVKAVAGGKP